MLLTWQKKISMALLNHFFLYWQKTKQGKTHKNAVVTVTSIEKCDCLCALKMMDTLFKGTLKCIYKLAYIVRLRCHEYKYTTHRSSGSLLRQKM